MRLVAAASKMIRPIIKGERSKELADYSVQQLRLQAHSINYMTI